MTTPGCHRPGTPEQCTQALALLERLAAELDQHGCQPSLRLAEDRWPSLDACAPTDPAITERIVATPTGLHLTWASRHLLARSNVRTAADRILWILRTRARSTLPATLQPALDDLTALHEELAEYGHHSDLITPTPYLLLAGHTSHPIRIYPSGPCFCWSPDLTIGDRDQIPTTARTLAWALNTGPPPAHP